MSSTPSVVISCAGIGSRLGLGCTKALITLEGKTLIGWQMELLADIEDVRVVVGFQANDVIKEVLKHRRDVIFVYNHNYFETKTGASFYLGARHANEYVIAYDGDLLVHPDDLKMLLNLREEFVAYAEVFSTDSVFVRTDSQGSVMSFSQVRGDYEWTGPACLRRDRVQYTTGNVYNQLEKLLPMHGIKIRACDIDTYEDYQQALKLIEEWKTPK